MGKICKPILWFAVVASVGTVICASPLAASGQVLEPQPQSTTPNPLADPTMKPGKMLLFDLSLIHIYDASADSSRRA